MEIEIIVHITITIVSLAFITGKTYQSLKSRPTTAKVEEMIQEKIEGHCIYSNDITQLLEWKVVKDSEEKTVDKKLDTIIIHLKQVCAKQGIEWKSPEL